MERRQRTLIFVFTDIVDSTPQWERDAARMRAAVDLHDRILLSAAERHAGRVFGNPGDGFCLAFEAADQALSACLEAQRDLTAAEWPGGAPLQVRIGVHAGQAEVVEENYRGLEPSKAARICGLARGGMIVASRVVVDLACKRLPAGSWWKAHGALRAKGLSEPEQIFELRHPDLPEVGRPLVSHAGTPNNLPRQLTTFIGRQQETAELQALLEGRRLVTVTGAGGSGKTRLALQVAVEVLDSHPDGVWLVELSSLGDAAQVPGAFAAPLGIEEAAGLDTVQAVVDACAERKMLLVVDNCEHLREASAAVIGRLLTETAHLRVLATSREPLGLAGEQRFALDPLPAPPTGAVGEGIERFDSVALFLERAGRVKHGFRLTPEIAPSVASICRRLDGIPLAIELAAARVGELRPAEIDEYLGDRFALLRREKSDHVRDSRLNALETAIDWSYRLLSAPLARLFRQCAVFTGGWTLEAALDVCVEDYDGRPETKRKLQQELAALVQKSLVIRDEVSGRYRMLESVREFALKRARASKNWAAVQRRWFQHFLSLALDAEPHLQAADQKEWLDRLDADHANFREALNFDADPNDRLRMATALQMFWILRGYLREGRAQIDRAINAAPNPPPESAAAAQNGSGNLSFALGDYAAAETAYRSGLATAKAAGDRNSEARALNNLGNVAIRRREAHTAMYFYTASLDLYRQLGASDRILTVSINQGTHLTLLGEHLAAIDAFGSALAAEATHPSPNQRGTILYNLAFAYRCTGMLAKALSCLAECVEVYSELQCETGVAEAMYMAGAVMVEAHRFLEAGRCFAVADHAANTVGVRAESVQCQSHPEDRKRVIAEIGPDELARLQHLANNTGPLDVLREIDMRPANEPGTGPASERKDNVNAESRSS